jgi:hypothetical protein
VCGREFAGNARDVCSWQCDEKRLNKLKKKVEDAVKSDKTHTKKLSEGGS